MAHWWQCNNCGNTNAMSVLTCPRCYNYFDRHRDRTSDYPHANAYAQLPGGGRGNTFGEYYYGDAYPSDGKDGYGKTLTQG